MPSTDPTARAEAPTLGSPEPREPEAEPPRLAARLRRAASRLPRLQDFGTRQILLRAAALTYLSIVSLIPLLTVGFMGIQLLGLVDLEEKARLFLFDNLAVGVREEVAEHLTSLLASAQEVLSSGGIVGLALLLLSAVLLLRNIERAFDELWGQTRMRPLRKQIALYLGLLFAGPIVLGLSLAATATLETWAAVHGLPFGQRLLSTVPFALSALGFSLVYKLAPATVVRWRAALIAGFFAAAVWEGAKVGYAAYAVSSLRGGSIYGPLAALPTFLVWLYLSWLIVLFGARLAFAIQHPELLRLAADPRAASKTLELCALEVVLACRRAPARSLSALAHELGFPVELVRAVVQDLEEARILRWQEGIRLDREAGAIQVTEVLAAIRGRRAAGKGARERELIRLLRAGDRAALQALSLDLDALAAAVEGERAAIDPAFARG